MTAEMEKTGLTPQQIAYCQHRAMGELPKYQCYMLAYDCTRNTANAGDGWQRLEKKPEIMEYIKKLQKDTEVAGTLTRIEKRLFLARVVRASWKQFNGNPEIIDPESGEITDGDLINSITTKFDKDGNHLGDKIELPSKLEAIKIDNLMAGHNEPEETNVNLLGQGVMLVPVGGNTQEEWERAAMAQQEELKAGKTQAAPPPDEDDGADGSSLLD